MIIGVDFGHGGNDSGAIGGGVLEKDINKKIGERVVYHLLRHNQKVIITRDNDNTVSLDERVNKIVSSKCDIAISIHCNSYTDTSVRGVETYTWGSGKREKQLAKLVHNEILKSKLYSKDRGLKEEQFRILSPNIPICLVELAFISNCEDRLMLINNIEGYAVAIARGLLSYYEIPWKKESNETAPDKMYYVQVGAFKEEKNAIELCERLRKDGYPSFIKS